MGWLETIACLLTNIALAFEWAVVECLNLLVLALGAFAALLVLLLPTMPSGPSTPSSGILAVLNWIAPIYSLVGVFSTVLLLYLAVVLIRVALRWVKVL